MSKLVDLFFKKNGKFSKTAVFLSVGTFILLALWVFQSLFAGVTLLGWWLIPEFNVAAATAVFGILATLYVANHSLTEGKKVTGQDLEDIKESISQSINSLRDEKREE